MSGFVRMCDSSGVLQGFAFQELDCETNIVTQRYQVLGTPTTTTTLPVGWEPCCSTEDSAGFYPMFTTADDPSTLVGWVWISADASTSPPTYTQQYLTLAGAVTNALPAGWVQGACGSTSGGGGGGGPAAVAEIAECVHLYLFSSMVIQDTYYPDWGLPGLSDSDRTDVLMIPPGYDGADWTRISVLVTNVTAALASNLGIELLDLTNSVTVGSITIPSGTTPIGNQIIAYATISSGSFTDLTKIQWHVTTAEDGNSFGLHAQACYNLIVETAS